MRQLGKYELVELLGRGGMGEVWKARDTALDRVVAVKLMQRTDPQDLARFKREAHAVAQVVHPHIAQLYDFSENPPYLVMQYVDGVPLGKFTPSPSPQEVLRARVTALRDAARAVAEAHARGVFHRDLKPDNILVDATGRAFVLDFGLARVARGDLTAMSLTGDILGTPSFMSPEQAGGRVNQLDARTDVYGLGATLYAVLAGRPPHVGPTAYAVIKDVIDKDPPAPPGDAELAAISMKAIEKEREGRYASAADFADDLERWLGGQPVLARPPTWTHRMVKRVRRNPTPYALTGVIALILLGVAGWFGGGAILRSVRASRERDAAEAALRSGDWQAALGHAQGGLVLAPDDAALARLRDRSLSVGQVADASEAVRLRGVAEEALGRARVLLTRAEQLVLKTSAPSVKRAALWPCEDQVAQMEANVRGLLSRMEQSAHAALRYDRDNADARRLLARLYLDQWDRALAERDATEAARLRDLVEAYGGTDLLAAAEAPVRVTLTVTPPDAEAWLFAYEERDRRLVPVPCRRPAPPPCPGGSAAGQVRPAEGRGGEGGAGHGDADIPSVDPVPQDASAAERRSAREGTAYPLACGGNRVAFSAAPAEGGRADLPAHGEPAARAARPLDLPPGSYLVLLRREGCADTRLPILVERGTPLEASVALPRLEDVPRGFVFVPGGAFTAGGDPRAEDPTGEGRSRQAGLRPVVGDFFIQRGSVTCGEYLEFLNDRGRHTAREALRRSPRSSPASGAYWTIPGDGIEMSPQFEPDWPVFGISCADAGEYARWYTDRHGEGRWEFSLPSEDEWEKAARGVDGRWFPWGNRFDEGFCAMSGSRESSEGSPRQPEATGLFPADESPYGVRDVAGCIRNWTRTGTNGEAMRILKGGAWGTSAALCRSAARYMSEPTNVDDHYGMRLVATRRAAGEPGEDY